MFAFSILHLYLHKWCQEKNTKSCTGKTAKIESQNTFVCERAERASDFFGVFNHFRVKKRSFFTINVKFKVILSSKSGGGGMFVQAIPPPKIVGGYIPHPPPPGIYASAILDGDAVGGSCKIARTDPAHFAEGLSQPGSTSHTILINSMLNGDRSR